IDVYRKVGEEGMIWQRVRIALLACVASAAAAVSARADGAAPSDHGPAPPAPAPGGPAMQTVRVQEWVPEHYQATRTVSKTECVQQAYTAYRTECVPETR